MKLTNLFFYAASLILFLFLLWYHTPVWADTNYCERTTITSCTHNKGVSGSGSAASQESMFFKLVIFVRFYVGGPLVVSGFTSDETCRKAAMKITANFPAEAIIWTSCVRTDLP